MATNITLTEDERTEAGLITLGCDTCRAAAGLLPLHPQVIADHTWYYCPTCGCQWIADRAWYHDRPDGRMHPVDAFFGITWLAIAFTMLVGIYYLVMADGVARYGRDYLDNGHVIAALLVG